MNLMAAGEILRGKSMVARNNSADKLLVGGLHIRLHTQKEEGGWRETWTLSRKDDMAKVAEDLDMVLRFVSFPGQEPEIQWTEDGKAIIHFKRSDTRGKPEKDRPLPPKEVPRAPVIYNEEEDGPLPKGIPLASSPGDRYKGWIPLGHPAHMLPDEDDD